MTSRGKWVAGDVIARAPRTYAEWFRTVAVTEAVSWVGLLIAMGFKYGASIEQGVTVMGWIHGIVFTAYVAVSLVVFSPLRWRFRVLVLALVCSIPPLASVAFERWAHRRGLLRVPDAEGPTFWGRIGWVFRELN